MKSLVVVLTILAIGLFAPATAQEVPQSRAQMTLSFAPLLHRARPAVVNIYARRVVQGRRSPFAEDPFFNQFFRDFTTPVERVQNSLGSGVILTADGLVMSNYHVVGGATDIRVVLGDRREFAASVILSDEEADLAVLRLAGAEGLPFLPLSDSDTAEVGDLVLAIGNPFGVGQTVSSGIVSGLARSALSIGSGRGYFIQTDAPINPGNSGGALIDMQGRLLGINTAILTQSGGSNGVGFAIPSNLVRQMLSQAQAGADAFERPWAGVSGQAVDAQMAEALGLPLPQGVVLSQLHPQSPFGDAGLRPGDVILRIGEAAVNSPQEIVYRMAVAGVGSGLEVAYWRDGTEGRAQLALISPPAADSAPVRITRGALAGLTAEDVSPRVIARFGLPLMSQGVVISALEGPLAGAGFRVGDILLAVNGTPLAKAGDLPQISLAQLRRWAVDLQRGEQQLRLRFRL